MSFQEMLTSVTSEFDNGKIIPPKFSVYKAKPATTTPYLSTLFQTWFTL